MNALSLEKERLQSILSEAPAQNSPDASIVAANDDSLAVNKVEV